MATVPLELRLAIKVAAAVQSPEHELFEFAPNVQRHSLPSLIPATECESLVHPGCVFGFATCTKTEKLYSFEGTTIENVGRL